MDIFLLATTIHVSFYYKQKLFHRMYNPGGMPLQEEPFLLVETPNDCLSLEAETIFFDFLDSFHI